MFAPFNCPGLRGSAASMGRRAMELVLLWALIGGGVVAVIASSKNFDTLAWFVYGALIWPIALAHVIVKPAKEKRQAAELASPSESPDPTKKCPECAEAIKAEAVVCRFCGNRNFPVAEPTTLTEDEWFASLNVPDIDFHEWQRRLKRR